MTQDSDYTQDPICRLCGEPYAIHPRCECCGIFCGPNHFREEVSRYHGKWVCDLCIEEWKSLEEREGHKVRWEVFSDRRFTRPSGKLRE